MKGSVSKVGSRVPGMAAPHRVMSASNFKGQVNPVSSRKISASGGFMASRKKGSVKGC